MAGGALHVSGPEQRYCEAGGVHLNVEWSSFSLGGLGPAVEPV